MSQSAKTASRPAAVEAAERHLREHLRKIGADKGQGASELLALYRRDYHTCDCEWPFIERKWSESVGVFAEIRLCCLAKAVEQITGLRLFEVFDFTPLWTWKCNELVPQQDGTWAERGCPPDFMLSRMKKRGILALHGEKPH